MKADDRARLTAALRDHVARIAADLRATMRALGAARVAAEQLHEDERVAEDFEVWTDLLSRRAAVLLEEHGRPGAVVVLGDTALFGLCEALDFPRRLYDETLSGRRGFWVLVVPGVIHNRQPRFNEGPPIWHLEGATLPLLNRLPGGSA